MSDEERRTVAVTAAILLLASLARFVWEARPTPPILPPSPVPAALVEETGREVDEEERMQTPLAAGETVDPNRDPEVELARLPGVGPALAARIVASRNADGWFRTPNDLLRVSGIGTATLKRIQPLIELADPPAQTSSSAAGRRGPSSMTASGVDGRRQVVDLNRASEAELEALPGVGPTLAQRIVEYRSRSGRFSGVDQLREVSGIGDATLERLRPLVHVSR
jgi:comEA protein